MGSCGAGKGRSNCGGEESRLMRAERRGTEEEEGAFSPSEAGGLSKRGLRRSEWRGRDREAGEENGDGTVVTGVRNSDASRSSRSGEEEVGVAMLEIAGSEGRAAERGAGEREEEVHSEEFGEAEDEEERRGPQEAGSS